MLMGRQEAAKRTKQAVICVDEKLSEQNDFVGYIVPSKRTGGAYDWIREYKVTKPEVENSFFFILNPEERQCLYTELPEKHRLQKQKAANVCFILSFFFFLYI